MTTRQFTKAEIQEQDLDSIYSEPWRHGTSQTFVFEFGNAHWSFVARVHHDDGIQFEGPVIATQVHQVERTVKVWEPVT